MNTRTAFSICVALLTGCSTPPIVGGPDTKEVVIEGERVWVAPMPDKNSWGATRYRAGAFLPPNPAADTALLSKAIEEVSGCKVTHYHYTHIQNLYATVTCQ
jgi:hypothetical protein